MPGVPLSESQATARAPSVEVQACCAHLCVCPVPALRIARAVRRNPLVTCYAIAYPPLQPRLTLPDISSPARSHLPWLEPALSPPSATDAVLAMRSIVPEQGALCGLRG